MEPEMLSQQQRKRLDRQRFIGWQTQRKLINSRVLITPANGPNTELAKNLILAGVNVTLYDDATVNQDDFESNFLIAECDLNRNRSEAVFEKLKEMNPTGKNQVHNEKLIGQLHHKQDSFFKPFTIIVTSTSSFEETTKWDQLSKRLNIPYYNLVCCGLYSFAYISLGDTYEYKQLSKKDKSVSKIWEVKAYALEECLNASFLTKNKQSTFLAAIIMMSKAQANNLSFDPFSEEDSSTLSQIVDLGLEISTKNNEHFFRTFATTYGIDYCPVYSVLGSIISQEIIKIVQNQNQPAMNWLVFHSEEGYATVVKVKGQKEKISSRVPAENNGLSKPEELIIT